MPSANYKRKFFPSTGSLPGSSNKRRRLRGSSHVRNAMSRTKRINTHNDLASLKISRGLRTSYRSADQMLTIRHRRMKPYALVVKDKRGRLAKLVEPAQIVDVRKNQDASAIEAPSGGQFATELTFMTDANLAQWLTASAGMTSSLANDGGRGTVPTTSGGTTQSAGSNITASKSMGVVKFPVCKFRVCMKNCTNMRGHVEIYDYVCKADTSVGPLQAWEDVFLSTNEVTSSAQRTTLAAAVTGYDGTTVPSTATIGYKPMGRALKHYWGLVASMKYDVEPGRTLAYEFQALRKSYSQWETNNNAGTYVKGWSRVLVIIVRGSLVSAAAASLTNNDTLSYSDARFLRSIEQRIMFYGYRQYLPQRSIIYDTEEGASVAANNYYQDVGPTEQQQINPETDAASGGYNAAYA